MSKVGSCETLFAGTTMLGRNATAHQAVEMDIDELIRATRLYRSYVWSRSSSMILFPCTIYNYQLHCIHTGHKVQEEKIARLRASLGGDLSADTEAPPMVEGAVQCYTCYA